MISPEKRLIWFLFSLFVIGIGIPTSVIILTEDNSHILKPGDCE